MKGLSQERACPKHVEGPVPRAGLSQACGRACPKSGLLFLHNNTMGKLSSQRRPSPTHRGQEMLDSWNMHGKEPRRIRLMALTALRRAKLIHTRLVPTRQAHCLHVEHMPAMSNVTPVSWQRKHLHAGARAVARNLSDKAFPEQICEPSCLPQCLPNSSSPSSPNGP